MGSAADARGSVAGTTGTAVDTVKDAPDAGASPDGGQPRRRRCHRLRHRLPLSLRPFPAQPVRAAGRRRACLDKAEPLKDELVSAGGEVAHGVKGVAQDAVAEVKATAADGTQAVTDTVHDGVDELTTSTTKDGADAVKQSATTSSESTIRSVARPDRAAAGGSAICGSSDRLPSLRGAFTARSFSGRSARPLVRIGADVGPTQEDAGTWARSTAGSPSSPGPASVAVPLLFAREGAKVVVNDLGGGTDGSGDDASAAQQVVDEITAMGGEAVASHHDVADADQAEALVSLAVDSFGDVDVLVNNAGILRYGWSSA